MNTFVQSARYLKELPMQSKPQSAVVLHIPKTSAPVVPGPTVIAPQLLQQIAGGCPRGGWAPASPADTSSGAW